jgi:hypothetical protein
VRDDVIGHGEPLRELSAVALVPVDELDDARRLACRPDAFVDAVRFERIDQPDAPIRNERVRTTLEELVNEPPEPALELVAEAGAHAGEITGTS